MNVKRRSSLKKKKSTRRISKNSTKAKKQRALKLLDELKGIGQGIWNEDAQLYVNKLRDNDR